MKTLRRPSQMWRSTPTSDVTDNKSSNDGRWVRFNLDQIRRLKTLLTMSFDTMYWIQELL
jgi:hypothetical protein